MRGARCCDLEVLRDNNSHRLTAIGSVVGKLNILTHWRVSAEIHSRITCAICRGHNNCMRVISSTSIYKKNCALQLRRSSRYCREIGISCNVINRSLNSRITGIILIGVYIIVKRRTGAPTTGINVPNIRISGASNIHRIVHPVDRFGGFLPVIITSQSGPNTLRSKVHAVRPIPIRKQIIQIRTIVAGRIVVRGCSISICISRCIVRIIGPAIITAKCNHIGFGNYICMPRACFFSSIWRLSFRSMVWRFCWSSALFWISLDSSRSSRREAVATYRPPT